MSDSEGQEEKKVLPKRSTRGNRMAQVMLEQEDADKDFYGQSYFQDSEEDDDFEEIDVEEDVPDADFFDPEIEQSESDEEEKERRAERESKKKQNKKRGVYVEPVKKIKTEKKERRRKDPVLRELDEMAASTGDEDILPSRRHSVGRTDRVLRTTTRDETLSREVMRKEMEEIKKTKPKKERKEIRKMTQEEILKEAKLTEEQNLESLSFLEALEEERKKVTIKTVEVTGPRVRFHSKNQKSTVTFFECNPHRVLNPNAQPRIRFFNSLLRRKTAEPYRASVNSSQQHTNNPSSQLAVSTHSTSNTHNTSSLSSNGALSLQPTAAPPQTGLRINLKLSVRPPSQPKPKE